MMLHTCKQMSSAPRAITAPKNLPNQHFKCSHVFTCVCQTVGIKTKAGTDSTL